MKTLSLIIPTYNMENYLSQCLDSLVISAEQMNKMEVWIVNDGSKDRSSEIGHAYAERYPGVFFVLDKENGNYGSCINAALPCATGKYIKVLDADDSFDTANLASFIDCLDNTSVDMVLSRHLVVDEQGKQIEKYCSSFELPANEELDFWTFCARYHRIEMHCVTYHRRVFEGWNYRQTEGVSYTDMEWTFYPMTKVRTVWYHDRVIYRYLLGRIGQTCDKSVNIKCIGQHIRINNKRLEYYQGHGQSLAEPIKKYLANCLAHELVQIYYLSIYIEPLQLEEFVDMEKRFQQVEEVYNSPVVQNAVLAPRFPYRYIVPWRKHFKRNWLISMFIFLERLKG